MSFMNENVIDGKAVASQIKDETAVKVAELKARYGKVRGNRLLLTTAVPYGGLLMRGNEGKFAQVF
jgi:hypothetical protein